MTSAERTPDELRGDLRVLRAEVGDTVEELSHRVDVPARARATRDEAVQRLRERVGMASTSAAEKVPVVRSWVRENPMLVAAAGLSVALIVFQVLRSRSRN